MSMLFSPQQLGPLKIPNRIVVPPMCQYSAVNGLAGDWHLIHYGQLAFSGAGLIIVEASAVLPEGRISAWDLGLWSDETGASHARMIRSIRGYSETPLAVQLAHAGRKASQQKPWEGGKQIPSAKGGWRTVAPSAIAYDDGEEVPEALSHEAVQKVITAFAEAAGRAAKAGYNAVEIHAAHGYLLHEFLSPLSNRREDAYGGSLENRMRLVLEVYEAVRDTFPREGAVGLRFSATDWVDGGWTVDDSVALSLELKKRGCAYIHVSGGGLHPAQQLRVGPGYQVAYAADIKKAVGLPTIAVGLITEPEQAEQILMTGQADCVALGRGMLYDPRWPRHAAARLGDQVTAPPQFWRAAPHGHKKLFRQD